MKILSIYRYYWPDTAPYARILRPILESLANEGHVVTVFSGQPGYNDINHKTQPWYEYMNGVNIVRTWLLPEKKKNRILRTLNFLFFFLRSILFATVNRNKYDLLIINSFPPVLMGFSARLICKITKTPYIYHCQDIHPESSLLSGDLKMGMIYKILQKADINNCRKAALVVTLSDDMANTLKERGIPTEKIRVLNNFVVDVPTANSGILKTNAVFQILYAGNIGNFQGLDSVIDAAHLLENNRQIHFIFMGEGSAKARLMEKSGELLNRTVFFIPYQSPDVAFSAMENADLCLISLKPGLFKVAFPSKTMMYLAAGCPLLAIVEKESELAREIMNRGIGFVSSLELEDIKEAIDKAWAKRDSLKKKRQEIRFMAQNRFDSEAILKEWSKIIENSQKSNSQGNVNK